MKIEKEVIMENVLGLYAVGNIELDGERYYAAASENRNGKMFLIRAADKKIFQILGGAGGVMAALNLPGENAIFCIEEFYPVFDSRTAKIIKIAVSQTEDDTLEIERKILAEVPYIHRVAQLYEEDGTFLAAGRLCRHKENPDDWTTSGPLEIGVYNPVLDKVVFEPIHDGVFKHHAMYIKKNKEGYDDLYFGGLEGTFKTIRKNGRWETQRILSVPTSDIVYEDLDNDGEEELAIIEGFHGNKVTIFKRKSDRFIRALELPLNFGHVLWGGSFLGKPGLITGSRGGEKKLILYRLYSENGRLSVCEETVIDQGQAPAQIIVNEAGKFAEIVSANHGMAQLVRYKCWKN